MFKNKMKRSEKGKNRLVSTLNFSVASEQFRMLRTNIKFYSRRKPIKTLVITSALYSEGKSTIAANLAVVYAQEGKKVLLIDGDLRNPSIDELFDLRNSMGLSSILNNYTTIDNVIKQTFVNGLDVITSGPVPKNPTELLVADRMNKLLKIWSENYDFIIFDSSPLLSFTDGQIIADQCDASILVISSGKTNEEQVLRAREMISRGDSQLLGVILNDFSSRSNLVTFH